MYVTLLEEVLIHTLFTKIQMVALLEINSLLMEIATLLIQVMLIQTLLKTGNLMELTTVAEEIYINLKYKLILVLLIIMV
jgi:hypothetical protein